MFTVCVQREMISNKMKIVIDLSWLLYMKNFNDIPLNMIGELTLLYLYNMATG